MYGVTRHVAQTHVNRGEIPLGQATEPDGLAFNWSEEFYYV